MCGVNTRVKRSDMREQEWEDSKDQAGCGSAVQPRVTREPWVELSILFGTVGE